MMFVMSDIPMLLLGAWLKRSNYMLKSFANYWFDCKHTQCTFISFGTPHEMVSRENPPCSIEHIYIYVTQNRHAQLPYLPNATKTTYTPGGAPKRPKRPMFAFVRADK